MTEARKRNAENFRKARPTYHRDYRRANLVRRREYNKKRRLAQYGLSLADYERMCNEQNGKCKICSLVPNGVRSNGVLHVDHSHTTGEVRSLLCHRCNVVLGLIDENPEIAKRIIAYLTTGQTNEQTPDQ